jgi:phosphoenolpyruvate synthase/pyruvate phosphate dikinase
MSVVLLDKAIELSSFGGKAVQLGSAIRSGLPVPHGYAISYDLVNQIVNSNKNAFKEMDPIMFTINPLTGMDERMIEACWGLGESIVSGRITPDRYTVSRGAASIEIYTGSQETAIYPAKEGGTKEVKLDGQGIIGACLLEDHIRQLDHLATRCEQMFGKDLDIEWAFADNRLYLLQCRRKITTRRGLENQDAK